MRIGFLPLLLLPFPALAALPEFSAEYDFERGRMKIGETRLQLENSQDHIYRYTSRAKATGFVRLFVKDVIKEESIFRFEDGKFWPVSYEYRQENSSKNRNEDIAYDWTDGIAQVDYRGHRSNPELKPGTLDRFLLQLAITAEARNGNVDRIYRVLDNGRVKEYQLQSHGLESVATPAGRFDALRVMRVDGDSDKHLRMWLAPSLDYLPVKIEQEKNNEETLRLTLKRFHFDTSGTASGKQPTAE
ncbi:MAG: DUF3108 domain-containing protein [Proteobacteria bacterium]|nr:DUF3108 domain-containing protein [Pseudomonadota bacterium]